jgi:signal transduction histidine kinase
VEEAGDASRIADLERRIAELERTIGSRDELIGLVGHELRNPLSPVFLQAYHLMAEVRKAPSGSVSADWLIPRLDLFLRGLDRLLERLNRLMDLSALQSPEGISLVEEELDLSRVAEDVAASMAREAEAASCSMQVSTPGPLFGRWDRARVEQIAANLISNAIRFAAGSRIEIAVYARPDDTAALVVRDHGPGIAEDLRPRVFDRFERGDTRHHKGGLGLGLWIVHRLCETMGGSVVVDSQPGRGARFTVTLPRRWGCGGDGHGDHDG